MDLVEAALHVLGILQQALEPASVDAALQPRLLQLALQRPAELGRRHGAAGRLLLLLWRPGSRVAAGPPTPVPAAAAPAKLNGVMDRDLGAGSSVLLQRKP